MNNPKLADLVSRLKSFRFAATSEGALQDSIQTALAEFPRVERECNLSKRDRIDFQCGEVGIEVKVDGSKISVAAQLLRYCSHDRLKSLILVTTVPGHMSLQNMPNRFGVNITVIFVGFQAI